MTAGVTVHQILAAACRHYGITRDDLLAPSTTRRIARRRQVAMYVAHTVHSKPLSLVGRVFGGRHHTTVIQAAKTIAAELAAGDAAIAQAVTAVSLLIDPKAAA